MDKEKTVNNYFEFLAGVVSDDRFGKNVTYRRLLMHLHTIEFRWTITHYSDDMSEKEFDDEHERVIDEIIDNDFLNIYKKVYRNQKNTDPNTTEVA